MRVGEGQSRVAAEADTPAQNGHRGSGVRARYADSLGSYLSTISRKPLLSAAEERRLARRMRAGCEKSKDELVERNLRLVVNVAKRYRGLGVDFEELVQEGTLGLIRASEKFDPAKGYKFSTYAHWWIRQAAGRAIANHGRTVRIPVHMHEQLRSVRNAETKLAAELGKEPTEEDLAAELGVSPERIASMRSMRQSIASLDAAVGGGDEGDRDDRAAPGLVSFLRDETQTEEAQEKASAGEDRESLARALSGLPENEQFVIIHRYGLDGREVWTLKELAGELCTHRESIRQAQKRAEKRLKAEL